MIVPFHGSMFEFRMDCHCFNYWKVKGYVRSSLKKTRLSLYRRGNDRCPICLSTFTERDVEEGITATLEHVPPKSVAPKISLGMCLTCTDCNSDSGRGIDQAVGTLMGPQKARVDIRGIPHTAYITRNGPIKIQGRAELPEEFYMNTLKADEQFDMSFTRPQTRYASVSWLKSAYLSVFSLLGTCGYMFAESSAIRQVRKQILEPESDVIDHYAFMIDSQSPEYGILMNQRKYPCWAVMMGNCVVLLPCNGGDSLYDKTSGLADGKGEIGDGPLFYLSKFGRNKAVAVGVHDTEGLEKKVGSDLFGRNGVYGTGDREIPFVVADYNRQCISVILTMGLN